MILHVSIAHIIIKKMNKIDWVFDAVKFLLENTPTTNNEEERKSLIAEAEDHF